MGGAAKRGVGHAESPSVTQQVPRGGGGTGALELRFEFELELPRED